MFNFWWINNNSSSHYSDEWLQGFSQDPNFLFSTWRISSSVLFSRVLKVKKERKCLRFPRKGRGTKSKLSKAFLPIPRDWGRGCQGWQTTSLLTVKVNSVCLSHITHFILNNLIPLVSEYGDKENDQLRERFNINKDDFPVYKLFKQDEDDPTDFKGEIKVDELSRFVKKEAGLWIGVYHGDFFFLEWHLW